MTPRVALLAALLAPALSAQFSGLTATPDGSSVYFVSTLRLKDLNQPFNFKTYVASQNGVSLFRAREVTAMPRGSPACSVGGFVDYIAAETSSTDSVALLYLASDSGCSYPSNNLMTQVETASGSTNLRGVVRLSSGGRYGIVFLGATARYFDRVSISFLDIQSGAQTHINFTTVFPTSVQQPYSGGRAIANDGTAILATIDGNPTDGIYLSHGYLVKPGADPIPDSLPLIIDASGSKVLYQKQGLSLLDLWTQASTLLLPASAFVGPTDVPLYTLRMSDDARRLLFLRGGQRTCSIPRGALLYSASNTGSQFTWLDRAGKAAGLANPVTIAPSGSHRTHAASLFARTRAGGVDLWLLKSERGGASRLTLNSNQNTFPVWSPDGSAIVFSSGSPRNLFRAESSRPGIEQRLSHSATEQLANYSSRDGRWVLYYEVTPDNGRDLWVLPMAADGRIGVPKPYLQTKYNESFGRFSPELPPRWVAYQSDLTGRYEIYIQAFPDPHDTIQISTGVGQHPQWGAGGRELFYVSPKNKLMVVSLKLGANSVEPSVPRELFTLLVVTLTGGSSPYDTAADGQRFLVRALYGQAG